MVMGLWGTWSWQTHLLNHFLGVSLQSWEISNFPKKSNNVLSIVIGPIMTSYYIFNIFLFLYKF